MSEQDKRKWNQKYSAMIEQGQSPSVNPRLMEWTPSLTGGICLDLACGLGGNSLYLAEKGYQVSAVDISEIAIHYLNHAAKQQQLDVVGKVIDLDEFKLPNDCYDLIVITFFLDRRLFTEIKRAVKPGGLVFMETYYNSPLNTKPSVSKEYKLASQELIDQFSDWNLIHFAEDEERGLQSILAHKP